MDELQIWTLYSSNRIGTALVSIGIILSIWLSLRVAAATRASDATNLLGKGSLTVKHDDDEAWSSALNKLLNDKDLRNRLVFEGFKQANKYTYQKSAQQLLETWRQLIGIRRR